MILLTVNHFQKLSFALALAVEFLSDSVEVDEIAKPVYNFKAC